MSEQLSYQKFAYKVLNKLGLQKLSSYSVYGETGVVILRPFKTLYFPIPKVANSSLTIACAELLKIEVPEDSMSARQLLPYIKLNQVTQYQDYWKFCFVRNPWDRLVSCFSEKIKRKDYNLEGHFVNGVAQGLLKYGNFRAKMPFDEFVQAVVQIPDVKADSHFRSQYTFVTNQSGKLVVDFVGKLETISEDFSIVCNKLGVNNVMLPHKLKSSRTEYREYYTPKLQETVAERYSKDIALFNYKF